MTMHEIVELSPPALVPRLPLRPRVRVSTFTVHTFRFRHSPCRPQERWQCIWYLVNGSRWVRAMSLLSVVMSVSASDLNDSSTHREKESFVDVRAFDPHTKVAEQSRTLRSLPSSLVDQHLQVQGGQALPVHFHACVPPHWRRHPPHRRIMPVFPKARSRTEGRPPLRAPNSCQSVGIPCTLTGASFITKRAQDSSAA